MALIAINVEEIGATGLAWLLFTYGFVLFKASNLISEGSDLLLLVPSLAGLVGGVVLPLLGAVPDGAIMLFSGLGDLETAQDNLSVGVGALAGSTIMLITLSLSFSVLAGRVNVVNGVANYKGKPKLDASKTFFDSLFTTGVSISPQVNKGSLIMMITTVSYLIIQIPASFLTDVDFRAVGKEEKYWALSGLIVCVASFVAYLVLQYKMSINLENFDKMVIGMKQALDNGKISLHTCLFDFIVGLQTWEKQSSSRDLGVEPKFLDSEDRLLLGVKTFEKGYPLLTALLQGPFNKYDTDKSKSLDRFEMKVCLMDLNLANIDEFVDGLMEEFDSDNNGTFSLDEFVHATYSTFKSEYSKGSFNSKKISSTSAEILTAEENEEEEEIPEEFLDLSPDAQQSAIKKRAFSMLIIGTILVVLFSDPMVDVIGEIAQRTNISAFYVSFTLVPIASNASEVIASQFYAKKKTSKTISVSLSALEGAAAMNNTFCLAIFMALVYVRGLAWQFTAETIAIIVVQIIVGIYLRQKIITSFSAYVILLLFPLSLALVATLESFGFD